ncbi:MAG: hypothetical protein JST54_11120 [Deltaproteobacteria bacterium]|nr:hypothetical protein [Deltaproteobacteria bacterium]
MKKILSAVLAGSMMLMAGSAFAAEVDRREVRQQERISQGVRDGSLTPRETAKLERKESHLRREVRRDRMENGGRLSPGEKAHINREENRVSREIRRDKTNGQHL